MDISSITEPTSTSTLSNGGKVQTSSSTSFSMEDFFKLLAAQLQYQDPTSSTSNDQFMQEMAQFSTVQAIQNLVKIENYTMASSVVGKTVSYNKVVSNASGSSYSTKQTGVVQAVDFSSETPKCYVSTTESDGTITSSWINYSDIKRVYSSEVTINSNSNSSSGTSA